MRATGRYPVICGKHRYYSEAAQSLVEHTGINDPLQAIENLANDLLQDAGVNAIPVNLELLASLQGVESVDTIDMDDSGRLIPLPNGGYRIQVKASDTLGRRNFSCAHEIGHTLIPVLNGPHSIKSDSITGDYDDAEEEEYFCDVAARTLLLPEKYVRDECEHVEHSLDGLIELSERFQSSIESIALRINQLQLWECVAVIWERMIKPSQVLPQGQAAFPGMESISTPMEEWRVKFHVWRDGNVLFPAKKHIPSNRHMIQECITGSRYRGECIIPYVGGEKIFRVDAQLLSYRISPDEIKNRIISLVFIQ